VSSLYRFIVLAVSQACEFSPCLGVGLCLLENAAHFGGWKQGRLRQQGGLACMVAVGVRRVQPLLSWKRPPWRTDCTIRVGVMTAGVAARHSGSRQTNACAWTTAAGC